ncbi:hypothetical protein EYF80_023782 [Liparis tanakae]|uniref:Uncharacterized protein n=1 Tax=Liparis tanakae TaxID=230148 RepID=A0A4Z2HJT2_9TELE|nr:hypothetical protein EYF80_023782 [Liparis tanakae]
MEENHAEKVAVPALSSQRMSESHTVAKNTGRHSSSILATQRRKTSSESGLTKHGWRGNGRYEGGRGVSAARSNDLSPRLAGMMKPDDV